MADLSIRRSLDRLLSQDGASSVRVTTADGPFTQGEVMSFAAWDATRRLARANGVSVPDGGVTMNRDQAARFAAALRNGAAETENWTEPAREAVALLLRVLGQGQGIIVAAVQGERPPEPVRERVVPRRTGKMVVLQSARDPQSGRRVVCDAGVWEAAGTLAAKHGCPVGQSDSISIIDAKNLANTLRRWGSDFADGRTLANIIALLELGQGVVVTRRARS